jgi:hypothetical protein
MEDVLKMGLGETDKFGGGLKVLRRFGRVKNGGRTNWV